MILHLAKSKIKPMCLTVFLKTEYPLGPIHHKDQNQSNYKKISETQLIKVKNHANVDGVCFVYFKSFKFLYLRAFQSEITYILALFLLNLTALFFIFTKVTIAERGGEGNFLLRCINQEAETQRYENLHSLCLAPPRKLLLLWTCNQNGYSRCR